MIILYTDGGCNNTTDKRGAYCYIAIETQLNLLRSDVQHGVMVFSGGNRLTSSTNNIAEMEAVLNGLVVCYAKNIIPDYIVTDSQYVQKGLTEWSDGWRCRGWRNSMGQQVSNLLLWKELIKEWDKIKHHTKIVHVRGHKGIYWNEQCDLVCRKLMA